MTEYLTNIILFKRLLCKALGDYIREAAHRARGGESVRTKRCCCAKSRNLDESSKPLTDRE